MSDTENKHVRKRRHKLVIEVGMITFLFFILTLIFTSLTNYMITRQAFLDSKDEMMERDLRGIQDRMKAIRNLGWVLDYMIENPDEVINADPEEDVLSDADAMGRIDDFISGKADPADATPEEQINYVRQIYSILGIYLDREHPEDNETWLIGIQDDHSIIKYMDDETYDTLKGFMEPLDYDLEEHKALKKLLSPKNASADKVYFEEYHDPDSGKAYYIGYLPVTKEIGSKCMIALRYDWSDYYNETYGRAKKSIIIGFFVLLVLNGFLMFFIYRKVISPLVKVKSSVMDYMNDKDSEAVIDKMIGIKTKNEIGVLADSFADLAEEIDRYTEEIVALNDEKTRINTELSLATSIQNSMLPSAEDAFPDRKDFDIYASVNPAKEVGGDFYDFFLIDDDHLCMIIADVSGKGVPAALFMMSSSLILRNQSTAGKTPSQILTDANKAIWSLNKEKMFVTVWLGILELSTGKLTATNGGHEYPAIKDESGRFSLFKDKHGMVVGALPKSVYTDYEIMLKRGDKIFVYTDGVPEATNSKNELFGTDRMIEALNENPDGSNREIMAQVNAAVDRFVKEAEQFDDLTMLCMEYHGK